MTVDDRLRDALHRRADAVVPSQPEWSRVAGRFVPPARRRRRAGVTSVVGAVVVVVAAVLVSTRGGSDRPQEVRTAGTPATTVPESPSARPAPALAPSSGPVPAGFQPVSVTWVSTRQGWVLGTAPCADRRCPALIRTTDGGSSWAGIPAPPAGVDGITGVRFADERNGWIYGINAIGVWATHDGGATWRHLDTPPGEVSSLEAGAGRVWAVARSTASYVYTSTVGTDDWRSAGSEPMFGTGVVLQGPIAYIAGADGVLLAISPAGLERRGLPCPQAGVELAGAGSDIVAVCTHGAAAGSSFKTLVRSSDGGRTWTAAGAPPSGGSVRGVAAASRTTIVVAAVSGASWLYRTDDGGQTWATVYTELGGGTPLDDLTFTDAARGFVVTRGPAGDGRLLLTTDSGRTWLPVTFGP